MKTMAAVLVAPGESLAIAELAIPSLAAGQALVELHWSGICHTQLLEVRGQRGDDPWLPHCLGHEGSGMVLEVGPDVTRVRPGDAVVLSWIQAAGRNAGGSRYDWHGRVVNAGPVTTFQERAVISEDRLTPLPAGIALREAALLGCALATGAGAVQRTGSARPGERVVVIGCGGVGTCAVIGARLAGAAAVVAVDPVAAKRSLARRLGASAAVDPDELDEPALAAAIEEAAGGPIDLAIEATGRPAAMALALSVVRPRGGRAVVLGNAPHGERLVLDPRQLNQGKRLLGSWGGDCVPDEDFPRLARALAEQRVPLAELSPHEFALEEVDVALEEIASGRTVRPLLRLPAATRGASPTGATVECATEARATVEHATDARATCDPARQDDPA